MDIKFRLYDGSDIGPFQYSSTSTVDMLKQRIVADWPKGWSTFIYQMDYGQIELVLDFVNELLILDVYHLNVWILDFGQLEIWLAFQ